MFGDWVIQLFSVNICGREISVDEDILPFVNAALRPDSQ
jgi:hypothetical protein